MKQRIIAKGVSSEKISVLPPWPHENEVFFNEEGRSIFRQGLNIEDKYVVMYSGNHSPCHPLSTLLETAKLLSDREEFVFLFVGGGSEHPKVKAFADQHKLQNVITLPYQPLHLLSSSLSAADLQVVVMGNEFVGTIHPCKIYNILMIGCPVLYIGPEESHIADILDTLDEEYSFISIRHGAAYKLKEMLEENLQKRSNKARYSDFKMTEDYKQLLVEEVLS